jgi:hypothetical protein
METRIRRYFTFRKLNSKLPQRSHTTDELDLVSIPYESTPKGRAPILSMGPVRREDARTKDDLDALAIRTFPYESAVAGTPPVFGATPIKGNGPVKLQTSRRLSSGELLVTTQDHQRTLSDIREGEYIVGRKEPKRVSKTISIKLPLHSSTSSPRPSLALAPRISSPLPSPIPPRSPLRNQTPEPNLSDNYTEPIGIPQPEFLQRERYSRSSSMTKTYLLGPADISLPLSPGRPPSSRNSLLSKGEEQNATIQALWKAEYARLVAIYGQDGVDRNIAELNKDHFATIPEKRPSVDTTGRKLSNASVGMHQTSGMDTIFPPSFKSPRASFAQDLPFVDTGSEYSSVKAPSLLSSEESSSSYTKRRSLFEADVPTTREEVSRIVENMRKNYLKALEAKSQDKPKTKRTKKTKQRASHAHVTVLATSVPSKTTKNGRQTWHASTNPNTTQQEKQTKKRTSSRPKTPRDSTVGPLKPSASKSSLKMKPQLHRADSTTLGSFFAAKKDEQKTPSPARTPKTSEVMKSPPVDKHEDGRPSTNGTITSKSFTDTIAPEIDDFDIFYQDLARDMESTTTNVKPTVPAIYVPHSGMLPQHPDDAAPPPPNIDWTPRKRPVLAAI